MSTYFFTIQDILDLINKSSAIRSLNSEKLIKILKIAHDPKSEKAQDLYKTLIKERDQYIKINTKTISETNKIYTDFQIKLTGLKHQDIYQKIEKAEEEYERTEQETAQKLLKSLKNQ